ncbi:MAG TPA: hypothetical protein VII47_14655, partial [Actinomycetota bacterium]
MGHAAGDLDHEYERRAAEWTIRIISGIRGIANPIVIRPCAELRNVEAAIQKSLDRHASRGGRRHRGGRPRQRG